MIAHMVEMADGTEEEAIPPRDRGGSCSSVPGRPLVPRGKAYPRSSAGE